MRGVGGQETVEESDWVREPQCVKETETEIERGRDEQERRNALHAAISIKIECKETLVSLHTVMNVLFMSCRSTSPSDKSSPCLTYHVCATVKRLCLWILLFSSMRRSSRGELRGERRGEMEEGDRRCPLGLSGCSRFSRRIFTRSSLRPECLGMGGTARVSWWVTPMPACWAMPGPPSGLHQQHQQQQPKRIKQTYSGRIC